MTGSCSHVPGAVYIQHSEARVGTKDAVLQRLEIWAVIPECCFWSQTCRHRSGQPLLSHLHSCFKPLLLWLKWLSQNLKELAHFPPPFIFLILPFWEPNIEDEDIKSNYILGGNLTQTMHAQRKVQAQKRPEKTLRLHLILILDTETAYNNQKSENNNKTQLTLGKGETLISKAATLFDSIIWCPALNQNIARYTNKQESMAYSKEKSINRKCPWQKPDGGST